MTDSGLRDIEDRLALLNVKLQHFAKTMHLREFLRDTERKPRI